MASASAARLAARASANRVQLTSELSERLLAYFDLLTRWNRTINLTSLSDPDAAIDRLLLEPVMAGGLLPDGASLMDLGSGGGSPAIPLAMVLNSPRLVMVESRGRKCAFLREAAREARVNAVVEAVRFEELLGSPYRGSMDVVSIRAVRMDGPTLSAGAALVRPGGRVALFASSGQELSGIPESLRLDRTSPLIGDSTLTELVRV